MTLTMPKRNAPSICLQDLGLLDPASRLGIEWENLVRANPASGFMQSAHWAQFKSRIGLNVHHLGLFEDDKLFGGAIFYAAPNCKGAGFLAAPDGPVLPWNFTKNPEDAENSERTRLALNLLVEATQAEAKSFGTMALRIAPRLAPPKPEILSGFARAPIGLTENKTMYLDLEPEMETIKANIKPKARYNIGLSQRKGVRIRQESSLSAARDFYAVMQTVANRDKFSVEPLSFFMALLETLCPAGMARVFFAEHEGDILGALLMVTYGDRSTYLYGGTTDIKRNYMGGYALQWAAINAAKESGCKIYDFWGYDPVVSPDNNYAGFSRFKSQFSGQFVELLGTHDFYFIENFADVIIRAINEISPA